VSIRGLIAVSSLTPKHRLEECERDVEVWQRVLQVRSLVLSPHEDVETWIDFADLCRTSDRLNLAEKTLTSLVGTSYNALDPEVRRADQRSIKVTGRKSESSSRPSPCHIRVFPPCLGERHSR